MRISDWSSDVCSSDLGHVAGAPLDYSGLPGATNRAWDVTLLGELGVPDREALRPRNLTLEAWLKPDEGGGTYQGALFKASDSARSEEHTSELQSLMRISSAAFCLKNKPQI